MTFSENPSLLMKQKKPTFSFFSEKKYNLSPLSLFVFSFSKPFHSGHVGLICKHAGQGIFQENQFGFCYSKKLSASVDVGTGFFYQSAKFAGLKGVSTTIDAIYHLNSSVNIGCSLVNPISYCWEHGVYKRMNYKTSVMANCDVTPFFYLGMVISKEEDQPIDISAGINYTLNKKMQLNLGLMDQWSSLYVGVGYDIKKTRLKIFFNSHPVLGLSPSIFIGNMDE
jgi:hypothetical protein